MLDLLVIAPHPDDAELGCGGMLARAKVEGKRTGILDLSRGELGSKGRVEERAAEATEAARILQLDYRGNLGLPDGGIADVEEQRLKLAQVIRELKPKTVIAPLESDRHPDHLGASRLSASAIHFAGLKKSPLEGTPHKSRLLLYPGNYPAQPNLLVDVSEYIEIWQASVLAHQSQFHGEAASETVSMAGVEARRAMRRYWGNFVGVAYAEPLISSLPWLTRVW